MSDFTELKAKKLTELQEMAKQLNVPKYRSLNKPELIEQIINYQAKTVPAEDNKANEQPQEAAAKKETTTLPKAQINEPTAKKEPTRTLIMLPLALLIIVITTTAIIMVMVTARIAATITIITAITIAMIVI